MADAPAEDKTALRARVAALEHTLQELDDSAQTLKLLAEKQVAEINAKELLLSRKTEYVDELLEQLKALGAKLEAKATETQALETRSKRLDTEADELRDQLRKEEEEFAMVCAALEASEQALGRKNGELAAAGDTEKQLRRELERQQSVIRRLETSVEQLQPEKADASLSPRSFRENQLIRLRDDALEAKTRELWLLSGQNDQLHVQLDELEAALEQLQRTVLAKENDLVRRQRRVDRLEAELEALQVSRSQAEGREKAMEIATTQNAKLLQALEAQERLAEQLTVQLEDVGRECDQLRSAHRSHVTRAAESDVEALHQTKQAEHKAAAVGVLQEKLLRERKLLREELAKAQLQYQMELDKTQSELVMRRNKQFDLALKLQDVEAQLHDAGVARESAEELLLATQCRMQELERVLQDSLQWKKQLEAQLTEHKESATTAASQQSELLTEATREIAVLQQQLAGLKLTLATHTSQQKQQELRLREAKQTVSEQDALAREQKERIHRLVRDVNREAQSRAEVELERTLLREQLEAQRQQSESVVRESLRQKKVSDDKARRVAEQLAQLTSEFHAVQSAKSSLVSRFADAFAKAAASFTSDTLELRECWLVDEDLRPLLKMLEGAGSERLRRVDLRFNRLTSDGMGRFVAFLKRLVNGLLAAVAWSVGTGIREIDLRQNCISLDGIRVVASGLETLIATSRQGSNGSNGSNGGICWLKSVAVSDAGRIECFAAGGEAANTRYESQQDAAAAPILVVDISSNVDADWLVAEARQLHLLHRRRGKEGGGGSEGSNNRQLLKDALRSSRDSSLQEIYGLDLVAAFMGADDRPSPLSSSQAIAPRRKSASTELPARLPSPSLPLGAETASPRPDKEPGATTQLRSAVGSASTRLGSSLSLPRLAG
ncbi:hypothetical protein BBJ28_00013481 [Nothophytophthora sp. Chile5]|nr:hypothetical protein BBJ28_00013481 [Nothophytophthora sp. Chile5]